MGKIQQYDEATISIDRGYAKVHIAETTENTFTIDITESVDNKLYIGIPNHYGKNYLSWNEIIRIIQQSFSQN